jgi:MORN repeat protein
MKYEPPEEGVHRTNYPSGQIKSEFTIKNGEMNGISRDWHENGRLAEEKPFRKGALHGVCRQWNNKGELLGTSRFKSGTGIDQKWHENGQIASEFSYVRGKPCGRLRLWDPDGMLVGQLFYFDWRPISRKQYLEKCKLDPSLPRFEDKKPTNNLGNYLRRMRREKREQAKLGPTPEDLQYQKWFDEQRKAESKMKSSSEATRWLQKKTQGEKELGEMTRPEALRLVRKLYSCGAVKIWVTGIEHDGDGSEYSKNLTVKLPKDAQKRGKIYKLCIDPARPADTGPAIFTGQNYMSVSLL